MQRTVVQHTLFAIIVLCVPFANTQASKTSAQTQYVADQLDWVVTGDKCNLCRGYYFQPQDLILNPHPASAGTLTTQITSSGPAEFQRDGESTLTGHVVLLQPGRKITADTATIYRDMKTSKITAIKLVGNVHLQEYNKLVAGPYAYMDMAHDTILMNDALYHLGPLTGSVNPWEKQYEAWGRAKEIHNPSHDILQLKSASYTTCSPLNPVWMISASRLQLDRNTGLGTAHNAVLRIQKIPVAYFPYFYFPIDNRRVSGLLIPSFSHSNLRGYDIKQPIYWNIAPNYDMTITPEYTTQRDFALSDQFRYLTKQGSGKLNLELLPYDPAFAQYRSSTISQYQTYPAYVPYTDQLADMPTTRGFFTFNSEEQWSPDFQSNFNLNYVTDPYFFRDMGTPVIEDQPDQLLSQADVNYTGEHWNFLSMVQGYQTLHRIDEAYSPVFNQYERLPEFDTSTFYPEVWRDLNVHANAQAVNFNMDTSFPTQNNTLPTPVGQRMHVQPGIDYDKTWQGGYIDPQLYIDATGYSTHFDQTNQSPARGQFNEARALPIFDLDSALYMDRHFNFRKNEYVQTLEPRIAYLYVPYQNQNQYPDFDTQLLPFSYNQVFSLNRFAGFDRLDNANQMSFGMVSRIMDGEDGQEKLRGDLGVVAYFEKSKVQLPSGTIPDENFSPLVSTLRYSINKYWSTSANVAWDISSEQTNNGGADITFADQMNHVFDFGYQFVQGSGVNSLGFSNNTSEVHAGLAWPLWHHWTSLTYAAYNMTGEYPDDYFAGLQYDSCCWAFRFLFNRHFTGRSPASVPGNVINQYDNTYYLQLFLKGLTSVGTQNPAQLLTSAFPGYHDSFVNKF